MRSPLASLALVLLCAAALLIAACDSRSSPTPSSSGGGTWEERLKKGQKSAIEELAAQGSDGIKTVNRLLAHDDVQVVGMAALVTKKMGAAGEQTLGALVAALGRFPDQAFVKQAIKYRKAAAIPHIVQALKTSDVQMQEQAAKLLSGGLAEHGEPAVDPLIVVLQSNAPDKTKVEVMGALASIGIPADKRARPVLLEIQAKGGKLSTYAGRAVKRLDSAHAWKAKRDAIEAEKKAAEGK